MSQIFLLDIFVSHLRLCPEISEEVERRSLIIKITFEHFLPLAIRGDDAEPKILSDKSVDYLFYKGGIRYFSMETYDLVELMKKNLLRIGVYRNGDSFPLCQVEIPLFGCACSLISGDCGENSPQVLTIDGPYDLLDPGKNYSGQVHLNVTFVNCGRFADSQYSLQERTFIFKKSHQGSEFECFQVLVPESSSNDVKIDPRSFKQIPGINWSCEFQENIDNFIRDLIVIIPSSRHLLTGKPLLKTPHIFIEETKSSKKKKKASKGRKKKKK